MTPARRTASATASVSSTPRPTGFSTQRCLPASAAATATSRCIAFGTVMLTTSTAGSSSTARQSATVRSKPTRSACARRVSLMSAATTSRGFTPASGKCSSIRR